MKNISKLTKLIIILSIIWALFSVVLIATEHLFLPLNRLTLILYIAYSVFLVLLLTLSLNDAYEQLNDAKERKVIVMTAHDLKSVDNKSREHVLYYCPNSRGKFCLNCNHRKVHEHTEDCERYGCDIAVRVYN
jgi:hypothetical protein